MKEHHKTIKAGIPQMLKDGDMTLEQIIKKANEFQYIHKTQVSSLLKDLLSEKKIYRAKKGVYSLKDCGYAPTISDEKYSKLSPF